MGCFLSLQSIGIFVQKHTYRDNFYNCNVYSHQGYHRKQMQDKHTVCLDIPNHKHYALFGIFDGFNGDSAASYVSENIVNVINKLPDLEDDNVIINAIHNMDIQWLKQNEANNSGSTVVFAIIKATNNKYEINEATLASEILSPANKSASALAVSYQSLPSKSTSELYQNHNFEVRIFWAGDSRAIVIEKESHFKSLTIDHNCNVQSETKRIKNANGQIKNNKIDGVVAVSRGFGCHIMKSNKDLPHNKQKIISIGECQHINCKPNETLIIFCDGLVAPHWNNKTIVDNYNNIVKEHKNEKHSNLKCLMYLTEQAMDEGSRDNITAMSIEFQ